MKMILIFAFLHEKCRQSCRNFNVFGVMMTFYKIVHYIQASITHGSNTTMVVTLTFDNFLQDHIDKHWIANNGFLSISDILPLFQYETIRFCSGFYKRCCIVCFTTQNKICVSENCSSSTLTSFSSRKLGSYS